jgi:hypothetical protein
MTASDGSTKGYEALLEKMLKDRTMDPVTVFGWMDHVGSETMYARIMRLHHHLVRGQTDEGDLRAHAVEDVKTIGRDINAEGGIPAMHAVYYTLTSFVASTYEERSLIKKLDYLWDGIGSWQC